MPVYVFGLIGNTLVIRIVHKTREIHTTTNYLLANLAGYRCIAVLTIPMYFAYSGGLGPPVENLAILLYVCSYWGCCDGFNSLNSFSYRCRKVSRYIETFQLEFAVKRREYQESNCSYLDFQHSLRFSRIFPSRME